MRHGAADPRASEGPVLCPRVRSRQPQRVSIRKKPHHEADPANARAAARPAGCDTFPALPRRPQRAKCRASPAATAWRARVTGYAEEDRAVRRGGLPSHPMLLNTLPGTHASMHLKRQEWPLNAADACRIRMHRLGCCSKPRNGGSAGHRPAMHAPHMRNKQWLSHACNRSCCCVRLQVCMRLSPSSCSQAVASGSGGLQGCPACCQAPARVLDLLSNTWVERRGHIRPHQGSGAAFTLGGARPAVCLQVDCHLVVLLTAGGAHASGPGQATQGFSLVCLPGPRIPFGTLDLETQDTWRSHGRRMLHDSQQLLPTQFLGLVRCRACAGARVVASINGARNISAQVVAAPGTPEVLRFDLGRNELAEPAARLVGVGAAGGLLWRWQGGERHGVEMGDEAWGLHACLGLKLGMCHVPLGSARAAQFWCDHSAPRTRCLAGESPATIAGGPVEVRAQQVSHLSRVPSSHT